ncbi:hypothetical protein [Arcticibacter eurypsychrophilus]|uniref:hypothetical protein n=1 Tax=Arcticibacter eurypsychrophilus TaxID=1434752 RepID=UPI00084DD49E|nr:hypothetical protein [Arcticibacter eurypsychrophilus]
MKKLLLLILCIHSAQFVSAQIKNDSLEYRIRPDSLRTGELYLSIHNFNFLRNYEFFSKFQDGYTLYGTQLEPQLVYYANPKLVLTAGIHMRKDFGGKGIYKTYPLFSIKYQNKDLVFINGVLEGNIQHRYIEPIFDMERKITNPVEYGTQLQITKPSFFMDVFLNWNNMIYKYSGEQEQLFAGGTADISLFKSVRAKLTLPLQVLAFHQGGQIDTIDAPLKTIINGAAGLKFNYKLGKVFQSVFTENYLVKYIDHSSTHLQAYNSGKGLFLNAGVESKFGDLIFSYWHGNSYISSAGMPLYQSVSYNVGNEGYTEKIRELLLVRYVYKKKLVPNLYLDFRVEPAFDLGNNASKSFDFHHSLFLVYKQEFRLLGNK